MRRAAKIDDNQRAIVRALSQIPGCRVESLAGVGKGFPDLAVGYRGRNWLIEVKGARGRLTPDQVEWHSAWTGQAAVVRTVDEALNLLGVGGG